MKKLLIILTFFVLTDFVKAQTVPVAQTYPNAINYILPTHEDHVSGGIYDTNNHLIRTAFSNISGEAGLHTYVWDGRDDDGNLMTIGAPFRLKVIYNNDTYTWGVAGNTSTSLTGPNVWKAGSQPCSMFLNGTSMYVATGFSEGNASQHLFNISTPQVSTVYSSTALQTGQGSYWNAGSNKFAFWGGADYSGSHYFVFPERLSNNTEITFSGSTATTPSIGRSYHAIDITTAPITSFACQQNGYLFVGHNSTSNIDVVRAADSSGTVAQTISLSGVTALSVDKDNDNVLWIARGSTVTKYTINSDGTITSTASTMTGLSNAVAMQAQGGELAICDAGTQQIIKFYNSTSLAPTRTLGRVGGYINDPNVYNNKFYWSDLRGSLYTFITHDGTGGVWVGDPGNSRSLHFDSSGNYIEMIMYVGTYITYAPSTNTGMSYNVNICGNKNTSIFADYLEFNIDYTQPIATGWSLIKNWGYNLPAGWHGKGNLNGVYLYPNGREFAIIGQAGTPNTYLAELNSTGMHIIMTTIPQFCAFDKQGNLTTFNATNTTNSTRPLATAPAVLTYYKYPVTVPLTGNPTIGSAITVATINAGYSDPLPQDRNLYVTASGKIVVFDNTLSPTRDGSGVHKYFEAIYDSTTAVRLARFRVGTPTTYQGDYLTTGEYDTGNSLNYNGGSTSVAGNYIIDNDHGENWKKSEIGWYHIWDDKGLLMGSFGALGPQTVPAVAPYGFSSNTLKTNATQSGGNLYLWANDESQHAAFHQWKIGNTGSEGEYDSPIFPLDNRSYSVPSNITDYLANVPGGQVSVQGVSGKSQIPVTDVRNLSNANASGQFYSVTATQNYYQGLSNDITYHATFMAGTRSWTINLNTSPQWTLYGQLNLTVNSMISIEGSTALNYIQLLDNAGKVIARMYLYRTNRINFNNTWFGPFTNSHYKASDFTMQRKQGTNNVYFTIDMWGTKMTTTLPMYDVTADITHPAALQVVTQNLNQGFQVSVNKLRSL